jgi:hypothetical protein
MPITGPKSDERTPDRFLQCEDALEAEFQALVWKAVKAGWDEGEAAVAIASLADHHILSMRYDDETLASIRKLHG